MYPGAYTLPTDFLSSILFQPILSSSNQVKHARHLDFISNLRKNQENHASARELFRKFPDSKPGLSLTYPTLTAETYELAKEVLPEAELCSLRWCLDYYKAPATTPQGQAAKDALQEMFSNPHVNIVVTPSRNDQCNTDYEDIDRGMVSAELIASPPYGEELFPIFTEHRALADRNWMGTGMNFLTQDILKHCPGAIGLTETTSELAEEILLANPELALYDVAQSLK